MPKAGGPPPATPPVHGLPRASPEVGLPLLLGKRARAEVSSPQAGHGYLIRKEDPRDPWKPRRHGSMADCLSVAAAVAGPTVRSLLSVT